MTIQQQLDSGLSHHTAGRFAEAEKLYRQVLAQQPDRPDALHMLGAVVAQMGNLDKGIELMSRAIQLQPQCAEAHYNLGNALRDNAQLDEAIAAYRHAIQLKPDWADAHNNLGLALKAKGRLGECINAYRQAISFRSDFAEAHNNLGAALKDNGQLEQAIKCCGQAVRLKPEFAGAHTNLGNALKDNGQVSVAIAHYRRAIQLKPDFAPAYGNLANALMMSGHADEAISACRQALQLNPGLAQAYNNLANALKEVGQLDEAIDAYRQAIRLRPDRADAHSNLLFALNYLPNLDAQFILAEHRAWADRHARLPTGELTAHTNEPSPDRPLRIGYVSPDLRRHSVGYFIVSLLEHHDRQNHQIFCYANVQRPDDFTQRMKRSSDGWRFISGLTDQAVAELVRSDRIDILVDLSGHSAGNRLRILALKPAPTQVTYLGYPNTTGMSAIDYRLTDALADPPALTDELNAEKLWRLPACAWCYCPPQEAPDVQPRSSASITFGCFNAFAKINHKLAAIWAQILRRVPGSRLLVKSAGAGEASSRRWLTDQFTQHGISSDRIETLGHTVGCRAHLQVYRQVDIALDTYPYHGTTTTCEALWMGVPVVSLAGQTHVSRVGVSLLTNAGFPDLIAATPQQYVQIAGELAADLPRLAELRGTLRARMQASSLMDARGFARNVEAAYRQMWRNWCRTEGVSG